MHSSVVPGGLDDRLPECSDGSTCTEESIAHVPRGINSDEDRGGFICVVDAHGSRVCSLRVFNNVSAFETKQLIQEKEGTEIEWQELILGRVLMDAELVPIVDGVAVLTLVRRHLYQIVGICSGNGEHIFVDAAGEIRPGAKEPFMWRMVELADGVYAFQVHEGQHMGKYVCTLQCTPLSMKSKLLLSDEREAWTLVTKDASTLRMRVPAGSLAIGVRSMKKYAGIGGLFWHRQENYYDLSQKAGDDIGDDETLCIYRAHSPTTPVIWPERSEFESRLKR